MPPASGSTSGAPAADTVSRQLWTVKRSGDTIEIDLCGAVMSSSDQSFLNAMGANRECAYSGVALWLRPIDKDPVALHAWCHLLTEQQRNLHIYNGGLEFGAGFVPLTTAHPHSILRLTAVKVTVTSDIEEDVSNPDASGLLLGTTQPHSSLILEDCVFETTFESPVMSELVVCSVRLSGQVGTQRCKCCIYQQ
jgi:hypothetical protein